MNQKQVLKYSEDRQGNQKPVCSQQTENIGRFPRNTESFISCVLFSLKSGKKKKTVIILGTLHDIHSMNFGFGIFLKLQMYFLKISVCIATHLS